MNNLLANLHEPSLIIMDNAKYRKARPDNTPKPNQMKKQAVIDALKSRTVPCNNGIRSLEYKKIFKDWISANVGPELVTLPNDAGHTVLFTPPNHSDLQPIDLVWAFIKRNIGRKYNATTTLALVRERLLL